MQLLPGVTSGGQTRRQHLHLLHFHHLLHLLHLLPFISAFWSLAEFRLVTLKVSRSYTDDITTLKHAQLLLTPPPVICDACCVPSSGLTAAVVFPLDGSTIKVFMRGRPITMFIPSDVENYDEVRTELPAERLKLEWVYPSSALVRLVGRWVCFGLQVSP